MSWQEYVDEHLMCELPSGGHLQSAAIVGLDGGIWAESESFPGISDPELPKMMEALEGKGMGSFVIGGEKYMTIGCDPNNTLRGKKGQNGVTIKKTVSALVVGFYGEGVQPGDGNTVVENLGDYLAGQGI